MGIEPGQIPVAPLIAEIARSHGLTIDELFRRRPLLAALHVHYAQDHPGIFAACNRGHEIARLEGLRDA